MKCEYSKQLQGQIGSTISVPSIGVLFSFLGPLLGTLDEYSYYLYHNRSYTRSIRQTLLLLSNVMQQRFVFDPLASLQDLLANSLDFPKNPDSPRPFTKLKDDTTFLTTTYAYWLLNFPVALLIFVLLRFLSTKLIKWASKRIKRYIQVCFENYRYSIYFLIDTIGGNVRFIVFRCFSQLMFLVPLYSFSLFNLTFTHFTLFLMILCSTCGFLLCSFLTGNTPMRKLLSKYRLPLYALIFMNSLKFLQALSGAIHAYFCLNPLLQDSLLLAQNLICLVVHISFRSVFKIKSMFYYMLLQILIKLGLLTLFCVEDLTLNGEYQNDRVVGAVFGACELNLMSLVFVLAIFEVPFMTLSEYVMSYKSTNQGLEKRVSPQPVQKFQIDHEYRAYSNFSTTVNFFPNKSIFNSGIKLEKPLNQNSIFIKKVSL